MNLVFRYALIPFINWGQYIFYLLVIFIAANKRFGLIGYFSKLKGLSQKLSAWFSYKSLIWLVVLFKVFYALVETFGQYYIWSINSFTRLLLSGSAVDFTLLRKFSGSLFFFLNNRFGYFVFYVWERFWLEIVVSVIAAAAFYLFLVFLKKYRERFFEKGETELGFLLALMVGWSNFIVFLPLVFIGVLVVAAFRKMLLGEAYTTLGAPFLLAALIVLIFGNYLVSLFGLMPLRV